METQGWGDDIVYRGTHPVTFGYGFAFCEGDTSAGYDDLSGHGCPQCSYLRDEDGMLDRELLRSDKYALDLFYYRSAIYRDNL